MYVTLFSNIFFSETTWPIKAKFHVEPSLEEGSKIGLGNRTKMATMTIYGKNLQKYSSLESEG